MGSRTHSCESLFAVYAASRERAVRPAEEVGASLAALRCEQLHAVDEAGALVPRGGKDAEWRCDALDLAHGEDATVFALRVLIHRGDMPFVYLDRVVAEIVRRRWERELVRVSTENGGAPVFDALTRLCERGLVSYAFRRYITYYVRLGPGEDQETYRAAFERLREPSFRAAGAPPGVRRA